MGLAVGVGALADFMKFDEDGAAWIRTEVAAINAALAAHGYDTFVEPEHLPELHTRCPIGSYPYSWVHYLRRAYVYAKRRIPFVPLSTDGEVATDPATMDEAAMMESHLLCHSDAEGFYVPVDFPEIIFNERIAGSMVGSSYRLREELEFLAPALGITVANGELSNDEAARLGAIAVGSQWERELCTWLSHWEAARLSITHGTMIFYT